MNFPRRTLFRAFAAAVVGLTGSLIAGCASTPAGVSSNNSRQLVISMTVAGLIDPTMYYYVVFNTSNDASGSAGPVPPIAPNWGGNGFVTGSATQYVEFNQSVSGDGYGLGQIATTSDGNLQALPVNPGLISSDQPVTAGSNTLEFRIPLANLEPTGSNETITAIQINFINTNINPVNTNGELTSPKLFDALGNTLDTSDYSHYITIPTSQDGLYNNSTISGLSVEPTTQDVAQTYGVGSPTPATQSSTANPVNLDIINWSVQVTS